MNTLSSIMLDIEKYTTGDDKVYLYNIIYSTIMMEDDNEELNNLRVNITNCKNPCWQIIINIIDHIKINEIINYEKEISQILLPRLMTLNTKYARILHRLDDIKAIQIVKIQNIKMMVAYYERIIQQQVTNRIAIDDDILQLETELVRLTKDY